MNEREFRGQYEGNWEQPTTQQDNESICTKLLGWKRRLDGAWDLPSGAAMTDTPSFGNWRFCGLILDAVAKLDMLWEIGCSPGVVDMYRVQFMDKRLDLHVDTTHGSQFTAIRLAALALIKMSAL